MADEGLVVEHVAEVTSLRKMLRRGELDEVRARYEVAIVTRDEDDRLGETGLKDRARYEAAGIAVGEAP